MNMELNKIEIRKSDDFKNNKMVIIDIESVIDSNILYEILQTKLINFYNNKFFSVPENIYCYKFKKYNESIKLFVYINQLNYNDLMVFITDYLLFVDNLEVMNELKYIRG